MIKRYIQVHCNTIKLKEGKNLFDKLNLDWMAAGCISPVGPQATPVGATLVTLDCCTPWRKTNITKISSSRVSQILSR